ncbi:hypothetical protein [Agromyces larvae]|uniref:Uncharacterized protein n=1 Tax=Agromyces larvae TaxID=2929802 RepID=A0ABY4C2M4_9MICO|nr:hypothetical protein [Agromyces larvae]UOE45725.1 hypothetical protein MTO99_08265 [Agromyces larvae]
MGADDFDLAAYTRTAHGSHRAAIAGLGPPDALAGLGPSELALVALLRDLEGGTMAYLRRVLVTPTHKDARVTAFLVTWAFEKFWIADALGVVLEANGTHAADASELRPRGHRRARRGPVPRALGALFAGPPLVAAHLVSLAASDAVTRAAYASLAATTPSTSTAALYRRLAAVDERQGRFLRSEAAARLDPRAPGADHAVRLARRELRAELYPLGMADRPPADRVRFTRAVFGRGASAVDAALADVAALPGIDRPTLARMRERLLVGGPTVHPA